MSRLSVCDDAPSARHGAFAFYAVTLATYMATSAAPTPLYRLYQRMWAISPVLITVIFAAYALSLLVALLVAGSLSDHIGRRPVIFIALLVQAVSMAIFLVTDGGASLIAARTMQGIVTT
ncbi:MFS transporter [Breoghania sp.]|uniref:MFS transporter n=1 Tax=Breoghania sp. TaxID=2065378 RepID=UPI002620EF17|nr:MFS transporter [Breoghania sp.]MDJ0931329.1 MFS transporter [Breoghania sp.]